MEEACGGAGLGYLAHIVAMEGNPAVLRRRSACRMARTSESVRQPDPPPTALRHRAEIPAAADLSGEHVGALAMRQGRDDTGSDVVSMKLRADKQVTAYILSSGKMGSTNGRMPTRWWCNAKTDLSAAPRHDRVHHQNGVRVSAPAAKAGQTRHAAPTPPLFFDDCNAGGKTCSAKSAKASTC